MDKRTHSWLAGFLPYLLVAATFFLLGSLITWQLLRPANVNPSLPSANSTDSDKEAALPAEDPTSPGIFSADQNKVPAGAATLVGGGSHPQQGPFLELALLLAGDRQHLWKLEELEKALPLNRQLLARVEDGVPLAMLPSFRAKGNEGQLPDLTHVNDDEALAFCEALYKANLASVGAFANTARHDLTFSDLFNKPREHRGEVVHFEGQLRRLRRSDPPPNARAKGVHDLYEAWVNDPHYGNNPVCLVFTELPPGLKVVEQTDQPVTFDAYFFKKYRYLSADSTPGYAREAPLFIGRSPVLLEPPPPTVDFLKFNSSLLSLFLGLVLLTAGLGFGLHWWFHRSDRRIQDRLRRARRQEFVDPGAPNLPNTTSSNQ